MELPKGYTLDEIKAIVDMLDKLYNDIEQGREPKARYDKDGCANYDYWNEDKDYIDRYIWSGNDAEFCITTDKESGETYLSEYVVIISRDNEDENYYFTQDELYQMVGR